jgi:hypothetical protein
MIDFGGCFIRTTESDHEWREEEAYEDQEGAIGQVIETRLRKRRGGGYTYQKTAYKDRLGYDFTGSAGLGYENVGEYLQA